MLRFAADANLNARIVRGLRRRLPEIELLRVQDVGLADETDPDLLEWAALEDRILITHDVATMVGFAYVRVRDGKPMPGVVEVPAELSIGVAIEDLALLATAGRPEDCAGRVIFLPL